MHNNAVSSVKDEQFSSAGTQTRTDGAESAATGDVDDVADAADIAADGSPDVNANEV